MTNLNANEKEKEMEELVQRASVLKENNYIQFIKLCGRVEGLVEATNNNNNN